MEDKSVKRRNWIKNIAIIFLTVMLILTLFSQTFMNMTLPEVATQYIRGGSITTQIRNSGTVKAREVYMIVAENSTKIKDVAVKEGSEVKIGDTLYILEDDGSDQLIAAYEKLAEYKKKYNDTMELISPDYSADLLNISYAKEDLAKAREELAKLNVKKAEAVEKDAVLAKANADAKAAGKIYDDIKKEYDKTVAEIEAAEAKIAAIENGGIEYNKKESPGTLLTKAEEDLYTAERNIAAAEENKENAEKNVAAAELNVEKAGEILEAKTEAETEANDRLKEYTDSLETSSATEESVIAKERALESLELEYEHLLEDYHIAVNAYNLSVSEVKLSLDAATNAENVAFYEYMMSSGDEAKKSAWESAAEARRTIENEYNSLISNPPSSVRSLKQSLENKEISLKNAKEDLEREKAKLNSSLPQKLQEYKDAVSAAASEKKNAEKDQTLAQKAKEDADKLLKKSEDALAEAKEKLPAAKSTLELCTKLVMVEELSAELAIHESALEEAEINKEKAEEKYKELSENNSTASAIEKEIETAKDTVTSKERALETLETELNQAKAKAMGESEINSNTLKIIEESIKAQEEIVEELLDSERTSKVTTPVAGTVSSMKYVAGESISLGETIAEIHITEKGYVVSFPVTVAEASRIGIGDAASVQNYWGPSITGVVDSIKPDTSNPANSRIVTIAVTGDVTINTTLTFSIGQRSQSYDSIIPKSALREDNEGKYVLVIDAKSTPLGNRYTARKVPVQVLAEDESNAAVSGLTYSDVVITTSSTPIESGMQVRLPES